MDKAFKVAEERIKSDPNYSKEQAEVATGMAKGMSAKDKFEDVPGVGDAASFNKEENYLTVLVGAITFQVIANVGKDKAVNLDLAKKLANEVLAKCEWSCSIRGLRPFRPSWRSIPFLKIKTADLNGPPSLFLGNYFQFLSLRNFLVDAVPEAKALLKRLYHGGFGFLPVLLIISAEVGGHL